VSSAEILETTTDPLLFPEAEIVALYQELHEHTSGAYPRREWIDAAGGWAGWIFRAPHEHSWVAVAEGRLLGRANLQPLLEDPWPSPDYWRRAFPEGCGAEPAEIAVIGRMAVRPEAQGLGLGARLFAAALGRAHELGLKPATIHNADKSAIERIAFAASPSARVVQRYQASDEGWMSCILL
jgi:GNAT superfamily N-acetyltransferase